LEANQLRDHAGALGSDHRLKIRLADDARAVIGPGGLELGFEAQPFSEIELAVVDLADQVDDGFHAQAPILKISDELQPLDVLLSILGDAASDVRLRERSGLLVKADRSARHAGLRGELVDRIRMRRLEIVAHAASVIPSSRPSRSPRSSRSARAKRT